MKGIAIAGQTAGEAAWSIFMFALSLVVQVTVAPVLVMVVTITFEMTGPAQSAIAAADLGPSMGSL